MPQYTAGTWPHEFWRPVALSLTLLCVWLLVHKYGGLAYDAQIYAVQALSKIRPSLAADLFMQNVSQDQFSIFSSFYAVVIHFFGLRPAALLLTIVFTIWLLLASWRLVSSLTNPNMAWASVVLLLVMDGSYGAFGVFSITEPFLTARLPSEALVVSAFVEAVRGRPRTSLLLSFIAFFVHPIMALPGILIIASLNLRTSTTALSATLLVLAALPVAMIASAGWTSAGIFTVMDQSWLSVVLERSQFLFLNLWRGKDWALNMRPLLTLALAAVVFPDGIVRKLALGGAVTGMAGLGIAAIGSFVEPVALLIQGQAWRWMWTVVLLSILLLIPTGHRAMREPGCGLVCACLLVGGWLLPVQAGVFGVLLSICVWIARSKIAVFSTTRVRQIAGVLVVALLLWSLMESWRSLMALPRSSQGGSFLFACVMTIFTTKAWCLLFAGASWWAAKSTRGAFPAAATTTLLAATAVMLVLFLPSNSSSHGATSEVSEFSDWRKRIPEKSTVFVTNGADSGSFVWFTLQRNNYLSVSQSAGVVFSRATALEVRRRSEVLGPLTQPSWKILTELQNRSGASTLSTVKRALNHQPMTVKGLEEVCQDPLLGFVVSPDNVGLDPMVHTSAGPWENWKLYDCNRVRALADTT